MNKLQTIIILEWLSGSLFGIIVMLLWKFLLSNIFFLVIFVISAFFLMGSFHMAKKTRGFEYPIEPNMIERMFYQYPLIKRVIFLYFCIKMPFLIAIILDGGFQGGGNMWIFLIIPYFMPFIVAIYYEQMKIASD